MDKWIVGYLWLSCALACGIDFWLFNDPERTKGVRLFGAIVIALIGPPLAATFIFSHILRWMAAQKERA